MPRSGRLRTYIREVAASGTTEKLSFVPPFLVLIVEIILLLHAVGLQESYVILLTTILLILSLIEMILVTQEMHEHYQSSIFDRILTIKLDDFILRKKMRNVKILVEDFITNNPQYSDHRDEIYHIACQILETHKEEALETTLTDTLKKFMKRRKKLHVDDLLEAFLKKHPKYKRQRAEVYQKICQLKGVPDETSEDT